jgi:hypothetical protein
MSSPFTAVFHRQHHDNMMYTTVTIRFNQEWNICVAPRYRKETIRFAINSVVCLEIGRTYGLDEERVLVTTDDYYPTQSVRVCDWDVGVRMEENKSLGMKEARTITLHIYVSLDQYHDYSENDDEWSDGDVSGDREESEDEELVTGIDEIEL